MIAQIQIRRGTTSEWAAASPVILAAGEPGYDSTIKSMKIGDGVTEWASLPFSVACPYDVGDVLQTMNATSPATRWAGTSWAAIGAGTFLAAAGTDYAAGSTGGEAKHALTAGENASHRHGNIYRNNETTPLTYVNSSATEGNQLALLGYNVGSFKLTTSYSGSGTAHNNLPPYLAVYMWKRTA